MASEFSDLELCQAECRINIRKHIREWMGITLDDKCTRYSA